ncbi:hypothetical protein ACIA4M_08990 [Lactobacillus delbrueckii subsp. bulgaricus]
MDKIKGREYKLPKRLAIFFQLSCQNPLLVLDVLIDSCQLDGAIF